MGLSGLLAVILLGAPATSANRDVFELAWSAPDECPQRANVVGAVERLLGDLEPQAEPVRAGGHVRISQAGYVLTLEIRTGATVGERSLEGISCEDVVDAAALILAIAINPRVLEREVRPEPAPELEPAVEPSPSPSPSPPAVEVAPRGPVLVVRAGAGLGAFLLPGPTVGVSVAVGVTRRFWRAEAEGHYWFAREVTRDDQVSGRFQLGWAGVRGCAVPERGAFEFPLCAGLDVGAMRGEGLGDPLENAHVQDAIWLAVRGGPALVWRGNDWVGLRLAADGIVPLLRPRFDTQPSGREVYRVNPAGLQVQMGIEFRPF